MKQKSAKQAQPASNRVVALRVLAGLIGFRALTNVFKEVAGSGLVFFGGMLSGWPNRILAPALGICMLVYAWGLWNQRSFALPMGIVYAIFVVFNVALFPYRTGIPAAFTAWEYGVFGVLAIGLTTLPPFLLRRILQSTRG